MLKKHCIANQKKGKKKLYSCKNNALFVIVCVKENFIHCNKNKNLFYFYKNYQI